MSKNLNGRLQVVCSVIREEFHQVTELPARINAAWSKASQMNDDLYLDSVALNLHGFYSGIEKIFETIAERIDDALPAGEDWHKQLLMQMSLEIELVRPPVISKKTYELLNVYRGFRHVVRNVYTFNLSSEKLDPLVRNLEETYLSLKSDIDSFCKFITS
jgi:hypothetical protein